MSDSTDGTCHIRNCKRSAHWIVATQGHPNGDMNAWYCADHATLPAWGGSPAPYTITISGPYKKGRSDSGKESATATTEPS